MKMTLSEIAQAIGAVIPEQQATKYQTTIVTSIAIDSRKAQTNSLFAPLKDQRDGHDFVENAKAAGAVATFWQTGHPNQPSDIIVIEVDDVLTAMQCLAKYYLMKVNPKVVAITGSNGKTTTKDMTAAILATQHNVTKTIANFNNEIGVPLTILAMETNTEVLVVEMGMDRPGQLTFLSNLVEPDVAVITMIGEAHIEFFGTRDKIADAKMEITSGLKEDGLLIINGDEPLLTTRAKKFEPRTFGLTQTNYLYPEKVALTQDHSEFKVNRWPDVTFTVPLLGEFNVMNALAALLVGRHYHVHPEKMAQALANFQPTENRTQWLKGDAGEMILSDVYNANPTATKEVLRSFVKVPATGRHIVVLGDMLELGEQAPKLHAELADEIMPQQVQEVYLYGNLMAALQARLVKVYPAAQLHYYPQDQQSALIADLKDNVHFGDTVLLKASNGMKLNQVLAALR
ncbi:UDP-N-acetylmuramoyl-tripeptide--D-alanyl-D-alanine ligase [Lapidilactobacillus gannanensis]|uniref:UDP-N-acetylmuramoyl-tripeptide--D-alanyl-D-alanine ligase n=1 Tax=Lapidilactobacillus gannanensis TaxID=2486002 RepID=A0ABW4BLU6_9LACO|nr:UDP-N-acetylmuramoyl-tripeptide--D-alanyl-D-alanine ligase [Lapidilactobacillus gannanensis]